MIKQIQLRGISRTPSDRLSDDGGLSESLNMYMDTAENAPAFIPEDVTEDLGLPNNLQAEKIFIHKTANYKNIIAVLSDKIVAFTSKKGDDEPLLIMEKSFGNKVNSITSLGNTLIISSSSSLSYHLYKDGIYVDLGNKVPFLNINFNKQSHDPIELDYFKQYYGSSAGSSSEDGIFGPIWFRKGGKLSDIDLRLLAKDINMGALPSEELWTEENFSSDDTISDDSDSYWLKSFKESIIGLLNPLLTDIKGDSHFSGMLFIRYEIETYSGTVSSMPILIKSDFLELNVSQFSSIHAAASEDGYHNVVALRNTAKASLDVYDIIANLQIDEGLEQWKDIITKVNFYISIPSSFYLSDFLKLKDRAFNTYQTEGNYGLTIQITESSGVVYFNDFSEEEKALLEQSSLTYLVKSIPVFDDRGVLSEEITELAQGCKLAIKEELYNPDVLMDQKRLEGDDMKHYLQTAENLEVYNNQLILVQPSQLIGYDYNRLNAYDITKNVDEEQEVDYIITYDVTYLLQGATETKVVNAGPFTYRQTVNANSEYIYPFQIFPDSRAYKMIVRATRQKDYDGAVPTITYGEFDMLPHPYLDCAYYYGGFEKPLNELCTSAHIDIPPVNAMDDLDNKLLVSEINDPFSFPIEHRYTFQSKVLGIAIASTALSQGQFGQFPLYVFTEDGIWVMETASDGSFVTSKPLSREVCVNPDAIVSIDNAVVFVTDKAVMMIQGSEVANISPYMNGRHYTPNDSALSIIDKQEGYNELAIPIKDDDPFMSFVKSAKIAYDYSGQRLIFINTDKPFQYVYKIDTQTWHKVAYNEFDLISPLNSYPECLVQAEKDSNTCVYDLSTILDASRNQNTAKGVLVTRPFDLGMPDVYKSITSIKIRGDYDKGNVKYFLQGSDNGRDFYTLGSLRGKSWKMFRIFILADLEPTERISWIDVDFEPRYNNRLR